MHFTNETSSNGVIERDFTVGEIPGVVWWPASGPDRAPLVLMGHGGGRHKKAPAMTGRAHRIVTGCGFHVAAIDAPGHGDRPSTAHDEREIVVMTVGGPLAACRNVDRASRTDKFRALQDVGPGEGRHESPCRARCCR